MMGGTTLTQVSCSRCGGYGKWLGEKCEACDGIGLLAWDQDGNAVEPLRIRPYHSRRRHQFRTGLDQMPETIPGPDDPKRYRRRFPR